jgi:hypothetical protein
LNKLQKNQPEVITPPSKADKELASATHQKIITLMNETHAKEAELQSSYVKLGSLIFTMKAKTLWLALNYNTWTDYFTALQEKYDSGKSQLYAYMNIAKTLQPIVGEKLLLDMGVSKAGELSKAVSTTGKAPSDEILKDAVNPKISTKQFRQKLFDEQHITDHNEKGVWFDFGGFYLNPDEKQEILKAITLAKHIDPAVSVSLPEHVQRKEAILRLAREFIGTWGHGQ